MSLSVVASRPADLPPCLPAQEWCRLMRLQRPCTLLDLQGSDLQGSDLRRWLSAAARKCAPSPFHHLALLESAAGTHLSACERL